MPNLISTIPALSTLFLDGQELVPTGKAETYTTQGDIRNGLINSIKETTH